MKIVVEGCDGSGKSTLAQSLAEIYHVPYLHYGPELDSYQMMMAEAGKLGDCVIDRFHISQMVYGPIVRGEPGLTKGEQSDIEHQIGINDSCLIVCDPGWRTVQVEWDRVYPTAEQFLEVHLAYYAFDETCGTEMNYIEYNWKKDRPIELIREVEKCVW